MIISVQIQVDSYFNPIIVLFLTLIVQIRKTINKEFQSYYSLISNSIHKIYEVMRRLHFNPIIVLFLTL